MLTVVVKVSPSLIVDADEVIEYVGKGVVDVSRTEMDKVSPTWVVLDESEKSFMSNVSVPSVSESFARV